MWISEEVGHMGLDPRKELGGWKKSFRIKKSISIKSKHATGFLSEWVLSAILTHFILITNPLKNHYLHWQRRKQRHRVVMWIFRQLKIWNLVGAVYFIYLFFYFRFVCFSKDHHKSQRKGGKKEQFACPPLLMGMAAHKHWGACTPPHPTPVSLSRTLLELGHVDLWGQGAARSSLGPWGLMDR